MEPESGRPSLARAINVRRAIASSLVFSSLLPVGAHHLECSHVYPLRHYRQCNMALSSSIKSKFVTSLQFCLQYIIVLILTQGSWYTRMAVWVQERTVLL